MKLLLYKCSSSIEEGYTKGSNQGGTNPNSARPTSCGLYWNWCEVETVRFRNICGFLSCSSSDRATHTDHQSLVHILWLRQLGCGSLLTSPNLLYGSPQQVFIQEPSLLSLAFSGSFNDSICYINTEFRRNLHPMISRKRLCVK